MTVSTMALRCSLARLRVSPAAISSLPSFTRNGACRQKSYEASPAPPPPPFVDGAVPNSRAFRSFFAPSPAGDRGPTPPIASGKGRNRRGKNRRNNASPLSEIFAAERDLRALLCRTSSASILEVNAVLSGLARVRDRSVGERCLAYLSRIDSHVRLRPDAVTYNIVIGALSKGDAMGAQELYDHMEAKDVIGLNYVLRGWCRHGGPGRSLQVLNAAEREGGPGRPDAKSYGIVMKAFSDRGNGVAVCADLLNRTLGHFEGGRDDCAPTAHHYNYLLDAFCHAARDARTGDNWGARAHRLIERMEMNGGGKGDGDGKVRSAAPLPNSRSYDAAIATCLVCPSRSSPRRAVSLLRSLVERNSRDRELKPSPRTFSQVLSGLSHRSSRNPDAASLVEEVLKDMSEWYWDGRTDVPPDASRLTSAVSAHGRSGDPKRAADVVASMGDMCRAGNGAARPDIVTYNALLDACARAGDADGARRALADMQGAWGIKPDRISYQCAVRAHAVGQDVVGAIEALRKMAEKKMQPDVGTCNIVLRSWATAAHADGSNALEKMGEIFLVANAAVDDDARVGELVEPNSVTYSTAIDGAVRRERWVEVHALYELCCRDQMLNNFILEQLRRCMPKRAYSKLMEADCGAPVGEDEWNMHGEALWDDKAVS